MVSNFNSMIMDIYKPSILYSIAFIGRDNIVNLQDIGGVTKLHITHTLIIIEDVCYS